MSKLLGSVEDDRTFNFLLFEQQVEELAHNPSRLGGPHVCLILLHLKHIPLPSSNIRLECSKGLLWRGKVDDF